MQAVSLRRGLSGPQPSQANSLRYMLLIRQERASLSRDINE